MEGDASKHALRTLAIGAVFFGDSLTDAGTYGFRFTTNPGETQAQHIATALGQPTELNEEVGSYDGVYVRRQAGLC